MRKLVMSLYVYVSVCVCASAVVNSATGGVPFCCLDLQLKFNNYHVKLFDMVCKDASVHTTKYLMRSKSIHENLKTKICWLFVFM